MTLGRARIGAGTALWVALAAMAGCGGGERTPGAPRAASRSAAPACPDAAYISTAIGFPVRAMPAPAAASPGTLLCGYRATDTRLGAFVSIAMAPVAPGEDPMGEIQAAGMGAEPIDVGERAYAWGSPSKSEAAALRASRVYHVDVTATTPIGDRKAAVIAILRKVVG